MKQLINYMIFFVLSVSILAACKKDSPTPPIPPGPEMTLEAGTIGTNKAEVKLTNNGMTAYAYQVTTNLSATAPSAAVLFGTGTSDSLKQGENIITITGLEGNTDYLLYLATKSEKGFGEKILSLKFKTENYKDLLTITDHHYFGISFHIEVPEGKRIGYSILQRENYLTFKQQYHYVDASFLEHPIGMIDKSETITFTEATDPETGQAYRPFAPGEALTIIVGEMIEKVDEVTGETTWQPNFDYDKYNGYGPDPGPQQETEGPTEEECWLGVHDAQFPNCKAPTLTPDARVNIELIKKTTRTATFNLTPDDQVEAFAYNQMDVATWQSFVDEFGEDGAICWVTRNSYMATEATNLTVSPLQPGTQYKLIVIGKTNTEGTSNCINMMDFTAADPTKPAPEIIVTGIDAPEGEIESPYMVWFNIKSPTQDVVTAKYLANAPGEFVKLLNNGQTYTSMVDQMGNPLDQDAINAINSNTGFNISFPSWEDSETRLVVCGYTDEEVGNSPDKDKRAVSEKRTMEEPAAPAVTSNLFEELSGEWTLTVTKYIPTWNEELGKYEDILSPDPVKALIIIRDEFDYPATCPEEVYGMYPGKDREWVDALYADFLKSSAKYVRKCRQQNRLICEGMDIAGYKTKDYQSPYGLFISPYYSAYDTDELFFNFGPKWYLEIKEGDKVCVPTDINRIAPVANWSSMFTYYFSALSSESWANDLKELEVTVSDDKQTLTVNPVIINEQTFYPSLITVSGGQASPAAKCATFVLTKGWNPEASKASAGRKNSGTLQSVPGNRHLNLSKPFHRTRIGKIKIIQYKEANIEPLTPGKVQKIKKEKAQELKSKRH